MFHPNILRMISNGAAGRSLPDLNSLRALATDFFKVVRRFLVECSSRSMM
jgi:hypothetical protein